MSIISNIILGAIGSILATIILYVCSILYKVGYKEDFKFNLNVARTATYQIQNQHYFPEDLHKYFITFQEFPLGTHTFFCVKLYLIIFTFRISLYRDRI